MTSCSQETPPLPAEPADCVLDCLGLSCPVPMMEAARHIRAMRPGQVLLLLADDPATTDDMMAWCHLTGHEYLGTRVVGSQSHTRVRRRAPLAAS